MIDVADVDSVKLHALLNMRGKSGRKPPGYAFTNLFLG